MYTYAMQDMKERLTNKIEIRLQFVVIMLVFFLTIFSGVQLAGCILVAAYIIDYIFFTALGDKIDERHLKWLNNTVLIGIGSYVIPLASIATSTQASSVPIWQGYTLMGLIFISMWLMVSIPVALLIMLLAFGIDWKKKFK